MKKPGPLIKGRAFLLWRAGDFPGERLCGLFQADGQYVAGCAMQHVVGCRAQQQRKAVTTMTANHDQVAGLRFGQGMDFLARLAIGQVAVVF